jgi:hypothetical protein
VNEQHRSVLRLVIRLIDESGHAMPAAIERVTGLSKLDVQRSLRALRSFFVKASVNGNGDVTFIQEITYAAREAAEDQSSSQVSAAPTPVLFNSGNMIFGDITRSQVAANNHEATQQQSSTIAPGFQSTAEIVAEVLNKLTAAGLEGKQLDDTTTASRQVLEEVTQAEPDPGKVRQALAKVAGFLLVVVIDAATEELREIARAGISQITALLGV